jgi:hypothetical protein
MTFNENIGFWDKEVFFITFYENVGIGAKKCFYYFQGKHYIQNNSSHLMIISVDIKMSIV